MQCTEQRLHLEDMLVSSALKMINQINTRHSRKTYITDHNINLARLTALLSNSVMREHIRHSLRNCPYGMPFLHEVGCAEL